MLIPGPKMGCLVRRISAVVMLIMALAVCDTAFAQAGGGRGRAGRPGAGPKEGPKQPTKPTEKPIETPGMQTGTIVSYKPATEAEAEKGIAGYLTVRPFEKKAKLVKLTVFKENEEGQPSVSVKVGDHKFEVEDYSQLFWKGLYCTAGWGFKDESAKVKVKELRTLEFTQLEVSGKILSVEDDTVTIRAVPKNGQNWPHLAALEDDSKASTKATAPPKPKPVRQLKIKLKLVEDVSKLLDAEAEEASLSGFEVGQKIEASIVFSTKVGMVIKLSPPGVDGTAAGPPPPKPEDDGRGRRDNGGGGPRGRGPRGG